MKVLKLISLWIILGSLAIGMGLFYFFDAAGLAQQNWIYILSFATLGTALAILPLTRLKAWRQSLGLLLYCALYSLVFALTAPLSLSPIRAMQTMGTHLNAYQDIARSAIHSENLILQTIARHKYATSLPRASFKIEAGIEYGDMQTGILHCTRWNCSVEGLEATVRPVDKTLIVEARDETWRFVIDEGLQAGERYTENGVALYIYPQGKLSNKSKSFGNPYEIRFCRWLQERLENAPSTYPVAPREISERY